PYGELDAAAAAHAHPGVGPDADRARELRLADRSRPRRVHRAHEAQRAARLPDELRRAALVNERAAEARAAADPLLRALPVDAPFHLGARPRARTRSPAQRPRAL